MSIQNAERLNLFLDELQQTRQIYLKLIELTENQSLVIASGAPEEVIRLAEAKSRELSRLESYEGKIKEGQKFWQEIQGLLPQRDRDRVKEAIRQVEDTLRHLIQLEEEEGLALKRRRDETEKELKHLDNSRRLSQAYGTAKTPSFSSLDKRE